MCIRDRNYGARQEKRIRSGLKGAVLAALAFCTAVSVLVCVFARPLMQLFVSAEEGAVIVEGVRYLRIEGAFYCGIGCLFLLYEMCIRDRINPIKIRSISDWGFV